MFCFVFLEGWTSKNDFTPFPGSIKYFILYDLAGLLTFLGLKTFPLLYCKSSGVQNFQPLNIEDYSCRNSFGLSPNSLAPVLIVKDGF